MELFLWILLTVWLVNFTVFVVGYYVAAPVISWIRDTREERRRKDAEYERYLQSLRAVDYWTESGFTRR